MSAVVASMKARGGTSAQSRTVAVRPSRPAIVAEMSAASAGVKNVPGTLWAMARRNSPAALGIASRAAIQPAPAD